MESLTLVSAMEREFGIAVADEDLSVDLFRDLATLTDFVQARQGPLEETEAQQRHETPA
jgi:acyl carrier protein